MNKSNCPYCKEEVNSKAIICKHCHHRIHLNLRDKIIFAITNQNINIIDPIIPSFDISDCGIMCYMTTEKGNEEELKNCKDECNAISIITETVDKIRKDLERTFIEIIWDGGDIDPIPDDFEKMVRDRFSKIK